MTRHFLALAVAGSLAGCGSDAAGPGDTAGRAMSIAEGDAQEGALGMPLAVDPAVVVTTGNGTPQPGVEVLWQVTQGGGVVDVHRAFTDSAGRASVRWTLGDDIGPQLLYASTQGAAGVTFQARSDLFFSSVSTGWRHTCGLDPRGLAWCWGDNFWGQLGSGTRISSVESRPVAGRRSFDRVYAGMLHSCALTADGDAYCWGDNGYGQLGDGTSRSSTVPAAVLGGQRFRSLTIGYVHTCGVGLDGGLYCWGGNSYGQIGVAGEETCNLGGMIEPCFRLPARVGLPAVAVAAAAGETHTCAADGQERTFCWGLNDWGQLGTGSFGGSAAVPTQVVGNVRLRELAAWGRSTCGLDAAGSAYCWGQNVAGELGINSLLNLDRPTPVVAVSAPYVELGVGSAHACGRTAAGTVYCWGAVLGNGSAAGALAPTTVSGGRSYSALSVGGAQACGFAAGVWCWGSNQYGQLGVRTDSVAVAQAPLLVRRAPPGAPGAAASGAAASGAPGAAAQ
jgi:alpha-tubulin suppressor-like RCC1 family protein